MTTLTYNTNRQQAADMLGVSTRTIDRYVKGGKLSYKKVANKVILASEELHDLQQDFNLLHNTEVAQGTRERVIPMEKVKNTMATPNQAQPLNGIKEFADILGKKDQAIEEKNQLIYALQRKLGELETQMNQMMALPEVTEQKEELSNTIKTLEQEKTLLQQEVKKERLRNAVYIGLVLIAAVMILFFTFMA